MTIQARNHIGQGFYYAPENYSQTMTTKEWQETALYSGGQLMAVGHLWTLVGKRIAPGVYNITTKKYGSK